MSRFSCGGVVAVKPRPYRAPLFPASRWPRRIAAESGKSRPWRRFAAITRVKRRDRRADFAVLGMVMELPVRGSNFRSVIADHANVVRWPGSSTGGVHPVSITHWGVGHVARRMAHGEARSASTLGGSESHGVRRESDEPSFSPPAREVNAAATVRRRLPEWRWTGAEWRGGFTSKAAPVPKAATDTTAQGRGRKHGSKPRAATSEIPQDNP